MIPTPPAIVQPSLVAYESACRAVDAAREAFLLIDYEAREEIIPATKGLHGGIAKRERLFTAWPGWAKAQKAYNRAIDKAEREYAKLPVWLREYWGCCDD